MFRRVLTVAAVIAEFFILPNTSPVITNADILAQIEQRTNAGETFFDPEEGGFTGISDNTKFYMNEAGNPVIVFDKYEIAPGSVGTVEFEVVR